MVEQLADVPPLRAEPGGAAEAFVRRLAGDNGPARAASFASEAGQFQGAGLPAVLCGPGSIDQAHQPDEYVERRADGARRGLHGAGWWRRLASGASLLDTRNTARSAHVDPGDPRSGVVRVLSPKLE